MVKKKQLRISSPMAGNFIDPLAYITPLPNTPQESLLCDSGFDTPDSKRTRLTMPTPNPSNLEDSACISSSSMVSDFTLFESSEVGSVECDSQKLSPHPGWHSPSFYEISPLGLKLRKSPSLVDLFQLKMAQGQITQPPPKLSVLAQENSTKCLNTLTSPQEKIKASSFSATTLRIGTWERHSRYEGDVVAKCYYAKRKLVWEVLGNGLKSKMEVQWAHITEIKSHYFKDNEPGVLEIEISRPPLFFKETNPQPRKHTLWQATSDFTGGQASICKWHYLQFAPGVLNKHYEKLLQFDPRLRSLSEKTSQTTGSIYFEGLHESITEGKYDLHFDKFNNNNNNNNNNTLTPKIEIIELENASRVPNLYSLSIRDKCKENTMKIIKKEEFEASEQMPNRPRKEDRGLVNVSKGMGIFEEVLITPSNIVPKKQIMSLKKNEMDDLDYHLFSDAHITCMPGKRMNQVDAVMEPSSLVQMECSLPGSFDNYYQPATFYHGHLPIEEEHYNDLSMSSTSFEKSTTTSEDTIKFYSEYGGRHKSHPNYRVNHPQFISHLFDPPTLGIMEFLQTLGSCNDILK